MSDTAARPQLRPVAAPAAAPAAANLDAEEMLLGGLLMSGLASREATVSLIERIRATGLEPGDFYRPSHGWIFRVCLAVADLGQAVEPLIVVDELRRRGELDDIEGGAERIHELGALAPAMGNAPHYAQLVHHAARQRRQEQVAQALIQSARSGTFDTNDDLKAQIRGLLEPRSGIGLAGIDLADMLSGPLPPIEWLCEGLLERATVTLIVADGYVGKSLFTLDMLLSLRDGRPFVGFPTEKAAVGYVDAENSEREINRRLRKLGLTSEDCGGLFYTKARLNLSTADGIARLRATIIENNLDVVVLDSFRRVAPGVDENDSAAVSSFFDPLLALRDELGVTIIILHHTRKANELKPSDAAQMIRGSGDFRNAVDSMLFLRPKKDDRQRFVVEQSKIRSGMPLEPFVVFRDNGDGSTVRHVHDGMAATESLGADEAMLAEIIKALRSDGSSVMSRSALALRVGVDPKHTTFARALNLGWDADKLTRQQDGQTKPVYVGLGPAAFDEADEP